MHRDERFPLGPLLRRGAQRLSDRLLAKRRGRCPAHMGFPHLVLPLPPAIIGRGGVPLNGNYFGSRPSAPVSRTWSAPPRSIWKNMLSPRSVRSTIIEAVKAMLKSEKL